MLAYVKIAHYLDDLLIVVSLLCYIFITGCDWSGEKCNCDSNAYRWRADEGSITDTDFLPVVEIRSGDNDGYAEEARYTLGPLECI